MMATNVSTDRELAEDTARVIGTQYGFRRFYRMSFSHTLSVIRNSLKHFAMLSDKFLHLGQ
jgi:hypothetical protein